MTLKSLLPVPFAIAVCFALTVNAGQPQSATPQSPAPRTIGTRAQAKGIPNFGKVTPHLYRGGLPSAVGIQSLKKIGIDVIVDMRGKNEGEQQAAEKLGMQYVAIPSHCPFPHDAPFAKFLKVIQDNPGKKVFVHCRLGDDRTGMAVAAYRMANEGWSPEDAMNEMREFGFNTFHHSICPGMADYEKHFPEHLKTSPAFKDLLPMMPPTSPK